MYYVYVLKIRKNSYYIGYTSGLEKRLKEHKTKGQVKLVYYEAYPLEKLARDREKKLKYYGSGWRALKKRFSSA